MRHRLAATGVLAALVGGLVAYSAIPAGSGAAPASAVPTVAPVPASRTATASEGVTTSADVFGPGCDRLPQGDEPGSPAAMSTQPVAAAIAANPLLTGLAAAVNAVPGLADALDAQQGVTVVAPTDAAFEALRAQLGNERFTALLANPNELGALLSYHVVPERYTAEGLVAAGRTTQLAGGTVRIGGTAAAPTFTDGKGDVATVVCGNLPAANATVFVIDTVLVPAG
ncbi:fasciclin domain-containing protein [Pseudonocardia hispaniensis]|uniref:Fasciclin domain-containing protein n=1 Tax=Pseudonocardia hispaniensis TaxID=904933 RepID=A0ABW1IZQ7_9PSEU